METTISKPIAKRTSFEAFFIEALEDIYWAEKSLVKTLADLGRHAYSEVVKYSFSQQRENAAIHVIRLEQTFELLGKKIVYRKCNAIEDITKEIEEDLKSEESTPLYKDTVLISGARKFEHYEITSYSCLVQFSQLLGCDEVGGLLKQNLSEEKETDLFLGNLAGAYAGNQAIA